MFHFLLQQLVSSCFVPYSVSQTNSTLFHLYLSHHSILLRSKIHCFCIIPGHMVGESSVSFFPYKIFWAFFYKIMTQIAPWEQRLLLPYSPGTRDRFVTLFHMGDSWAPSSGKCGEKPLWLFRWRQWRHGWVAMALQTHRSQSEHQHEQVSPGQMWAHINIFNCVLQPVGCFLCFGFSEVEVI